MAVRLHTDNKFLPAPGRKYAKMSAYEFKSKFNSKFQDPLHVFDQSYIRNDLCKIDFSNENCTITPGEFQDNGGRMVGHQSIGDFNFVGFLAGGDWEFPLYFIVYHDGIRFRAYIPKCGNAYNSIYGSALGSEDDSMVVPSVLKGLNLSEEEMSKHCLRLITSSTYHDDINNNDYCHLVVEYDWHWIMEDICTRFSITRGITATNYADESGNFDVDVDDYKLELTYNSDGTQLIRKVHVDSLRSVDRSIPMLEPNEAWKLRTLRERISEVSKVIEWYNQTQGTTPPELIEECKGLKASYSMLSQQLIDSVGEHDE